MVLPVGPMPPSPTPPDDVPVTRATSDGRLLVEAGELGWAVVLDRWNILYDSRIASANGCDPVGWVAEYMRVRTNHSLRFW